MADTPESLAIREQTECMVHLCEDLTVVATTLEHIAETLDRVQQHFTGDLTHEYELPPEMLHPGGTHPHK
jgi:hypothetical protein